MKKHHKLNLNTLNHNRIYSRIHFWFFKKILSYSISVLYNFCIHPTLQALFFEKIIIDIHLIFSQGN